MDQWTSKADHEIRTEVLSMSASTIDRLFRMPQRQMFEEGGQGGRRTTAADKNALTVPLAGVSYAVPLTGVGGHRPAQ
jgi:hypothetical protein